MSSYESEFGFAVVALIIGLVVGIGSCASGHFGAGVIIVVLGIFIFALVGMGTHPGDRDQ